MIKFHNRLGFRVAFYLVLAMTPLLFGLAYWTISEETDRDRETSIDRGKVAALAGAAAYSRILEIGVTSGELKISELTDPHYVEIVYPCRPAHTRYHTGFDSYTDKNVVGIQEAILRSSSDFIYASGIDHGGYVPTPHDKYKSDPSCNEAWDSDHSRKKQRYTEDVVNQAAIFRGDPITPVKVQPYRRKGSEGMAWDIAAPIFVSGQFFGAFRVGVSWDEIEARRVSSSERLLIGFGIFTFFVWAVAILIVGRRMGPLTRLTLAARIIGSGADDFSTPVVRETDDEIGDMADETERMRLGLRASFLHIMGTL